MRASSAARLQRHPVVEAMARAPRVETLTTEQRAELDQMAEDVRAGRAQLVPHDEVPAWLERAWVEEHGPG